MPTCCGAYIQGVEEQLVHAPRRAREMAAMIRKMKTYKSPRELEKEIAAFYEANMVQVRAAVSVDELRVALELERRGAAGLALRTFFGDRTGSW